jgi:hypothetical protein
MKLAILMMVAACGSGEPGADWSGKPLDVPVKNTVLSAGFSLRLPAGMKLEAKGDELTREWIADQSDYFSEPTVTISYASIPPKDLDGFVQDAMLTNKDVVAKKAALPDGFILVHHTADHGLEVVELMRIKGSAHVTCRAGQARTGGVKNPEKTLAWLEQLCTTLAID